MKLNVIYKKYIEINILEQLFFSIKFHKCQNLYIFSIDKYFLKKILTELSTGRSSGAILYSFKSNCD